MKCDMLEVFVIEVLTLSHISLLVTTKIKKKIKKKKRQSRSTTSIPIFSFLIRHSYIYICGSNYVIFYMTALSCFVLHLYRNRWFTTSRDANSTIWYRIPVSSMRLNGGVVFHGYRNAIKSGAPPACEARRNEALYYAVNIKFKITADRNRPLTRFGADESVISDPITLDVLLMAIAGFGILLSKLNTRAKVETVEALDLLRREKKSLTNYY
ncbi:hypothetical protein PUN28_007719 [Cardiocondyla obscurior]|uniref:Uncharacterized protein n=1 Tax=Cardiocondyla obscurior TaxID=286306 RepID=A0AAW2FXG4_9HYME